MCLGKSKKLGEGAGKRRKRRKCMVGEVEGLGVRRTDMELLAGGHHWKDYRAVVILRDNAKSLAPKQSSWFPLGSGSLWM